MLTHVILALRRGGRHLFQTRAAARRRGTVAAITRVSVPLSRPHKAIAYAMDPPHRRDCLSGAFPRGEHLYEYEW